jgi:hypothetical protein
MFKNNHYRNWIKNEWDIKNQGVFYLDLQRAFEIAYEKEKKCNHEGSITEESDRITEFVTGILFVFIKRE